MSKLMFYTADNNYIEVDVYQRSMQILDNDMVFMADAGGTDVLVITSNGNYRILELNHETAMFLRKNFPFTAPSRVLRTDKTLGINDFSSISSNGYAAGVFGAEYIPILAQASFEDGSGFADALDAATFAVFKHGYKKAWGADGNDLKKPEDIERATSCGYTMITLDCSEYVKAGIDGIGNERLSELYVPNGALEARYIGRTFEIAEGIKITFDEQSHKENVVLYSAAIDYIEDMYALYIRDGKRDFEISFDRNTVITPAQHFFIANELALRGVIIDAFAPNFSCDITVFETEFAVHNAIAEKFNYKLSICSTLDESGIIPTLGRLGVSQIHIKNENRDDQ